MLKQISSFDGIKVSHRVMGEEWDSHREEISFPAVHRVQFGLFFLTVASNYKV